MKKDMIKFGCLALMGLSLAACSEESLENIIENPVAKKGITFEAKNFVNENGTRAEYTFGTDEVTLAFNSEDVIGVWGMRDGIKEQVSFHVSDAATDGMSATFDGGLWRLREDETKYVAVYPYNQSTNWDENGQYVDVFYSGLYFNGTDPVYSSLSWQDYMVSNAVSAEEGNASFTLEHLGAIVRVRLTGLPANAYVNSLTITSESNDFVSYGRVYIDETISGISITDPENDMTNQLYIDCDYVYSDANGEAFIYFMCAPTDLTGKTVNFSANVNGIPYTCEKTNITTITAGSVKPLVADVQMDMSGVQSLVEGENTIDPDATSYIFIPSATGLYTIYNVEVMGANKFWGDYGEQYILVEGNTYSINIYDTESPLTITKTDDLTELPLNELVTVSAGTNYIINIPADGVYDITYNNNSDNNEQNIYYLGNQVITINNDDEIIITKIETSPISVGTNTVDNGWYTLSVAEDGLYNVTWENGYVNNFSEGMNTLYAASSYYIQFDKSDSETPASITISKVDISTAEPISIGTEVSVTAGTLYSVELSESVSYRLTTTEEGDYCINWCDMPKDSGEPCPNDADGNHNFIKYIYISLNNEYCSMGLSTSFSNTCLTTGTYYFMPQEDATFTIVTE